ncbi:MAG: hypothetical protein IT423_11440 [Pirellulaceae bacterium]|nr:hypothetical protein [Pirellulaceae bacterium]
MKTVIITLLSMGFLLATCACGQKPAPGTIYLNSDKVTESSGLARSRRLERLLWTHNDSGDKPQLFAFDADGRLHATLEVKRADAVDWEDMCSFTHAEKPFLAVADVGDNGHSRKHVTIYGLEEPTVEFIPVAGNGDGNGDGKATKPARLSAKTEFEIKVTYPHGPINCEAIAYDPWRQQFILASKEQLRSQLFAISFDAQGGKQEVRAQLIGSFPVPTVTGASISDDGHLLALGTYGPSCLLRRTSAKTPGSSTPWQSANGDELELLPAPLRGQGESICFNKDATKLLMTSEGRPMPLLVSPIPSVQPVPTQP